MILYALLFSLFSNFCDNKDKYILGVSKSVILLIFFLQFK